MTYISSFLARREVPFNLKVLHNSQTGVASLPGMRITQGTRLARYTLLFFITCFSHHIAVVDPGQQS